MLLNDNLEVLLDKVKWKKNEVGRFNNEENEPTNCQLPHLAEVTDKLN